MADPYLGEIRLFPIGFAPQGWAFCEGQLLPINTNQALYSLLGTTYGGDGKTNFALPDLRGRVPVHFNTNFPLGTKQGEETHTLTQNEMPAHSHQVQASDSSPAPSVDPTNNVWAHATAPYTTPSSLTLMNEGAIGSAGTNQAHNNMQPYQAVHFCIALVGLYPSRS